MAFTGTAVVKQIADGIVRITGLSLAAGAAGTISLSGGNGAVKCPAGFQPGEYVYGGATIGLDDSIDVTALPAAVGVATAIPVSVVKTAQGPTAWLATITNTHGTTATPNLEIYVKFHQ
jgi:hypothetical protein